MPTKTQPPRLLLTFEEAAQSLGISLRHFRDEVLPEVKVVRIGRAVRVSVRELEKWTEASGTLI